MLEVLRAKVADPGIANIEVVEAGFLTYVHRAPPADLVYSRYASSPPPRLLESRRTPADLRRTQTRWALPTLRRRLQLRPCRRTSVCRGMVCDGRREHRLRMASRRARGAHSRRALHLHLGPRAHGRSRRPTYTRRRLLPGWLRRQLPLPATPVLRSSARTLDRQQHMGQPVRHGCGDGQGDVAAKPRTGRG